MAASRRTRPEPCQGEGLRGLAAAARGRSRRRPRGPGGERDRAGLHVAATIPFGPRRADRGGYNPRPREPREPCKETPSSSSTSARSTPSSSRAACASCRSTPRSFPPAPRPRPCARASPQGHRALRGPRQRLRQGRARAATPGSSTSACRVLGVCYGMQLMSHLLGGEVKRSAAAGVRPRRSSSPGDGLLLRGLAASDPGVDEPRRFDPEGARRASRSWPARAANAVAAMEARDRRLFGILFHPEVVHTEEGTKVLSNFLDVCGCRRDWNAASFVDESVEKIRGPGGGEGPGDLRPLGGRRLRGGGAARPSGHRRPAHLRVRGQRPAAQGRGRPGPPALRRAAAAQGGVRGRLAALPREASRA